MCLELSTVIKANERLEVINTRIAVDDTGEEEDGGYGD